ncbi:MAG: hypothetical protein O9308_09290 [Beijerinckiaceae bacterium]|nr:hypothetical protein [Beijerinckiaceae bacterium]
MFKPFAAANAVPVAARQIKLVPPAGNEAIVLQVAPGDTLDLSALADRKITMVRLDHRLVLLFEDKGHIVLEGALTPDGHPVDGILTSPVEGKVLPLADLLASMGPLHTAEIMTQAGVEAPPVIHSALAAIPPAIDYDPGRRPGLDLLGNEEFGSSLPLPEKKIGALDVDVEVDDPVVIDLDKRDDATNNYYGFYEIEAAASDALASPWSGVEIVQVSSADGVAHVAIFDPDGGPMPIRLVIELGDTRMGDPGLLQVDPAVLAQFGASVSGDGTGRIVLETGKPLSADEMTTLLAAIRYYNTEDTFLMDNADREITVTAIHEGGQTSSATAFVPVIAYVEDVSNIDFFIATRFSDIILGLNGDNVIDGGAGHDWIEAGDGNNRIDGGSGRDTILTGSGDDRIEGGSGGDFIQAGAGADLVSGGRGDDEIEGGDGDDRIEGGEGDDSVSGDDGDDIVRGDAGNDFIRGGAGTDVLLGGAGNDLLIGGTEDDRLEGGDGDDYLVGVSGDDRIEGGDGDDTIVVRISDGYDSHIDGGAGTDTLFITSDDPQTRFSVTLDGDQIREITLDSANTFDDIILTDAHGNRNVHGVEDFRLEQLSTPIGILDFSATQTAISVDLDVYTDRNVVFGTATGFSAITGFQDLIGGSGDDTLVGNGQHNEILGGDGNDRLEGEIGDDRLQGGSGDDILIGGSDNDDLEGSWGNDEIHGGDGRDWIIGGRGDDWIDGGDGNDFIRTNITDGFDSHVDGGAGFDRMLIESNAPGTRFAITLDGTAIRSLSQFSPNLSREVIATDAQGKSNVTGMERFELTQWFLMDGTLDFSSTQTDVAVDLDTQPRGGGTSGIATGFAEVYGFLHVTGGSGHDSLTGDAGDNILTGGAGDDALRGEAGNDTLRGGAGDDRIDGGDGDDVIVHGIGDGFDSKISGGAGNDVMRIETDLNSTYATIQLDTNGVVTGLTLDAIGVSEQVIATDAQGNRNVTGVENISLHHEGSADGTLDFSTATAAINVDLDGPFPGNGRGTATGFSEVVGFLNVIGGSGDDSISGDARDNLLQGGDGNDIILGGAGNDFIETGDGHDQVWGGDGDDYINTLSGPKYIDGGNGNDDIVGDASDDILIGGSGSDFLIGYLGNDQMDGGDDDDTLIAGGGDDRVWGGAGDDSLEGGSGNDIVSGDKGNDEIVGGDGDDFLFGEEGNDRIFGGSGNDFLAGYQGDDVLDGGDGDDRMLVQFGHNTLTGGNGADAFAISVGIIQFDPATNGNHVITDFDGGQGDTINFFSWNLMEPSALGGASTGVLAAERFTSGTAFTDTTQRFLFNTQDNTLYYDADGAGAASNMLAICTLLQGTLTANDIRIE